MEVNRLSDITDPRNTSFSLGLPNERKEKKFEEGNSAYKDMSKRWELIQALKGGTLEVRKASTKWLPREPKESLEAYNNRLNRSVVYGAYTRTVSTLSGLPFMRSATIEGLPKELSYLEWDVDGNGTDLTNFAHSLLRNGLDYGMAHVYVDMPEVSMPITLQDVEQYKIRPYFVLIEPTSLIDYTVERIGGLTNLSSIKIKEIVEEDGEEIEQIKIISTTTIEYWRRAEDKDEWYLVNRISNNLGKIPLITFYTEKTGYLSAKPPLEDLAWLNLRHYQKLSDLDNIEHIANVPILFGSGFQEGELDGVEIGPNRAITASDPNAKLSYVEHTAAAIGASQTSIDKLEMRMAAMGADLILRKSVDRQTATARQIDQSESISMLQVIINNLEAALEYAVEIAGDWIDVAVSNIQIEIGDNLKIGAEGPNWIDILGNFVIQNQGMSLEQAVLELKRRGVLVDNFTAKNNTLKTQPVSDSQPNPLVGD